MGRPHSRDSRDQVDDIMQGHQLHYSLVQLRLVGLLMLLFVLARSAVPLLLGFDGAPIQRLAAVTSLSAGLPLLPLGISLYLLGGGRQRLPQEFLPTTLLHRSLLPLALGCLLLLPALTVHSAIVLQYGRTEALAMQSELQNSHRQWLAEAEQATTAEQVRSLAARHQLTLPSMTVEPVELSRWRFSQVLEKELSNLRRQRPILSLSPYELELLSLPRVASTLLLQLITGVGLLLLQRQGSREIHRHGLSSAMFFRLDPVRHHRHAVHRRN
ncbi:MAG: hypothetical protein ACKOBY_04975 [Cyanobium sp.]